jgi:hypothetical protein
MDTNPNVWTMIGPFLAKFAKQGLQGAGVYLAANGYITSGAGTEAFVGAAMTLLGLFWDWWSASGAIQAEALLKKLTATHKAADALAVAKAMAPASVTGAAVEAKAETGVSGAAPVGNGAGVVVKALLLAIGVGLALFLSLPHAFAQTRTLRLPIDPLKLNGTVLSGDTSKDLKTLWAKIGAASLTDLQYASAMAAQAGTPAAKVRKQCWDGLIAMNEQINGTTLKNADGSAMLKPDPHLISDVESLAEIVDNLSTQGQLFSACSGAAEMAKMSALQFVTQAIAGLASFSALPVIP